MTLIFSPRSKHEFLVQISDLTNKLEISILSNLRFQWHSKNLPKRESVTLTRGCAGDFFYYFVEDVRTATTFIQIFCYITENAQWSGMLYFGIIFPM